MRLFTVFMIYSQYYSALQSNYYYYKLPPYILYTQMQFSGVFGLPCQQNYLIFHPKLLFFAFLLEDLYKLSSIVVATVIEVYSDVVPNHEQSLLRTDALQVLMLLADALQASEYFFRVRPFVNLVGIYKPLLKVSSFQNSFRKYTYVCIV